MINDFSRYAHVDDERNLQLLILRNFTEADGIPLIYIGREEIITYSLAWPIPHDAPYKEVLDRIISSVIEVS